MPADIPNIKAAVAVGYSISVALKGALQGGLTGFAKRHGFSVVEVSQCINGRVRHERIRAALATELHLDREWLDAELDRAVADRSDVGSSMAAG